VYKRTRASRTRYSRYRSNGGRPVGVPSIHVAY
jgi:hypothetical protein